jgi:hypothetical protein
MIRRIGKVLALFAMVAFIANAQCAFACVFPAAGSAPEQSGIALHVDVSHGCCPHQKNPETPGHPCPSAGAHADPTIGAEVSKPLSLHVESQSFAVANPGWDFSLSATFSRLPQPLAPQRIFDPPLSFSVLRI